MIDAVAKLQELIDGSENIVFFGGAGVSTESGSLFGDYGEAVGSHQCHDPVHGHGGL